MKYFLIILALFAFEATAQGWGYGSRLYSDPRPTYENGGPIMRGFSGYSDRERLDPPPAQYIPYIPEQRSPFYESGIPGPLSPQLKI